MQQSASGDKQPIEYDFGGGAFGVDFGLYVQIFLFALETNGDVLLVKSVVLKEGFSVKEFANILDAIAVDDAVEFVAL